MEHLFGNLRFELMHSDVTLPLHVGVDEIHNSACPAPPVHYPHDTVPTTKARVLGMFNPVALAKRVEAKILQALTREACGGRYVQPQEERDWRHASPVSVRSCYDAGKRCTGMLYWDNHRQDNLLGCAVRSLKGYGLMMHPHDGRPVTNSIVQARRSERIPLVEEGTQMWRFAL